MIICIFCLQNHPKRRSKRVSNVASISVEKQKPEIDSRVAPRKMRTVAIDSRKPEDSSFSTKTISRKSKKKHKKQKSARKLSSTRKRKRAIKEDDEAPKSKKLSL